RVYGVDEAFSRDPSAALLDRLALNCKGGVADGQARASSPGRVPRMPTHVDGKLRGEHAHDRGDAPGECRRGKEELSQEVAPENSRRAREELPLRELERITQLDEQRGGMKPRAAMCANFD